MKINKIESRYLRSNFIIEFVVSIVAGLSAFIWSFVFTSEAAMVDLRFALRASLAEQTSLDRNIVILEIPESVMVGYNRLNPRRITPRGYLARLVDFASRAGARVVALDYRFDVPTSEQEDRQLQTALRRAGNVVIGFEQTPALKGFSSATTPTLQDFVEAAFAAGYVNIGKDDKGVVRYYDFTHQGDPSLVHQIMACFFRDKLGLDQTAARFQKSRVSSKVKRFFGELGIPPACYSRPITINFHSRPGKLFTIYNSEELLNGPREFFAPYLKDKIVLIGDGSHRSPDIYTTPFSQKQGEPDTHGILIQAQVLRNFIQKDFIYHSPLGVNLLVALCVLAVSFAIAYRFRFLSASLLLVAWIILYAAFSCLVFIAWHTLLPVVVNVAIIFFVGLLTILFRIAFSEKDNIDARSRLAYNIPAAIIDRHLAQAEESIFTPREQDVVLLVCWPRNIPTVSPEHRADAIKEFLNYYFRSLKEAVFANEGVFNRIPPNGVLAFWNAPLEDPQAIDKALATAKEIVDRLGLINNKGRRLFSAFQEISIDSAIHRGQVLAGYFGADNYSDYTIMGEPVEQAYLVAQRFAGDEESWVVATEKVAPALDVGQLQGEPMTIEGIVVRRLRV